MESNKMDYTVKMMVGVQLSRIAKERIVEKSIRKYDAIGNVIGNQILKTSYLTPINQTIKGRTNWSKSIGTNERALINGGDSTCKIKYDYANLSEFLNGMEEEQETPSCVVFSTKLLHETSLNASYNPSTMFFGLEIPSETLAEKDGFCGELSYSVEVNIFIKKVSFILEHYFGYEGAVFVCSIVIPTTEEQNLC